MNQKLEKQNKEIAEKEEAKGTHGEISEIDKYRNSPNLKVKDFKLNEEIKEVSSSSMSENSFRVVVRTSAHRGLSKLDSSGSASKDQSSSSDKENWNGKRKILLNSSWLTTDLIRSGTLDFDKERFLGLSIYLESLIILEI